MNGWSMDKPGKTIGNIVSDTLTFMDDVGLSMAASDSPTHPAAIRTPLAVDRKILSIRKEPILSSFSHFKC